MSYSPGESAYRHGVLIPYSAFDADTLAEQMHRIVVKDTELLRARNLSGVITRYSDLDTAAVKIRKGQREHPILGHFAVVDKLDRVRGSASIYPDLELKRQRIPLPPRCAIGPLSERLPSVGPNVHAWTSTEDRKLLSDAYRELVELSSKWWRPDTAPQPWTVEPASSPPSIHAAIASSGLSFVGKGRYDDMESGLRIPPTSILYVRP